MRFRNPVIMLACIMALAGVGCRQRAELPAVSGGSQVSFRAADGWTIRGDFYPSARAKFAVLLLHQRNGSTADWSPLIPKLTARGIAVLAIDQRGAGRSTGRANGADAPWDTSPDIAAAVDWLKTKGFMVKRIGLAGASYGANNALIYAAAHPGHPAVALLSPGTDYHGLLIAPAAAHYSGRVLVLWSKQDNVMQGGPEALRKILGSRAEFQSYDGRAHGTDMLRTDPASVTAITNFFAQSAPR